MNPCRRHPVWPVRKLSASAPQRKGCIDQGRHCSHIKSFSIFIGMKAQANWGEGLACIHTVKHNYMQTLIPLYVHTYTRTHTYIHSFIHSFIRSYPVSSRKLSQSPLLGPNHLCWCPSLSLQSRGHGHNGNSDITDSTHPACRKKPSKQESNRVKSVASTLGSKLHAAKGSLLQHIR